MRITKLKMLAFVAVVGAATGGTAAVGSVGASSAPVSTQPDPDVLRIVYHVGVNHGASPKVMLAAFETCVVESGCRNLPDGDRDSAGAFQQRPSMGWGTYGQVTNVQYAARQFFIRAIANEHCCPTSGLLAQHVQKSCCPDKYDAHEVEARERMAKGRALHLRWVR
jgi:hypothetical protein